MSEEPRPRRVSSFLSSDRTPMWVTLCFLGFGATGTYYLAPRVNAQFEAQKIRADFVIRNYGDLRTKMEDFQGLYLVAVQKIAAGEDIKQELYKLQEISGRINAQVLSFMPMFATEQGPKATIELTRSLAAMVMVLREQEGRQLKTDDDAAAFNKAVATAGQALVRPLLEVYVRVGEIGNLSPTEKDKDLPQAR